MGDFLLGSALLKCTSRVQENLEISSVSQWCLQASLLFPYLQFECTTLVQQCFFTIVSLFSASLSLYIFLKTLSALALKTSVYQVTLHRTEQSRGTQLSR